MCLGQWWFPMYSHSNNLHIRSARAVPLVQWKYGPAYRVAFSDVVQSCIRSGVLVAHHRANSGGLLSSERVEERDPDQVDLSWMDLCVVVYTARELFGVILATHHDL